MRKLANQTRLDRLALKDANEVGDPIDGAYLY